MGGLYYHAPLNSGWPYDLLWPKMGVEVTTVNAQQNLRKPGSLSLCYNNQLCSHGNVSVILVTLTWGKAPEISDGCVMLVRGKPLLFKATELLGYFGTVA